MEIVANISAGELLDKVSILMIKEERIENSSKIIEVKKELKILLETCKENLDSFEPFLNSLKSVNEKLWDIEDKIRIKENKKEFDEEFIQLARSVYVTNDLRFNEKAKANSHYGSLINEQKSYEDYGEVSFKQE